VNDQSVQMEKWAETRKNLLKDYSPDDIPNANETGLFFKMLPDTNQTKDCHCTKKSTTPNTTSKTQQMDLGVIQNLKGHYRSRVVVKQIQSSR